MVGAAAAICMLRVMDHLRIEPMEQQDAAAVLAIYGEGIATGNATLETIVPDWRRWNATHRKESRFVARLGGVIVGWAALSAYSSREVYSGVAWESVYVADAAGGGGVGRAVLAALSRAAVAAGVWTLMAGVLAENAASIALHEHAGFRRIGVQEGLGRDATGRWRDVVLLERRSRHVARD